MNHPSRILVSAVAVLFVVAQASFGGPGDQLKVYFVGGYEAANRIDDDTWYGKRRTDFTGQNVVVFPNRYCLTPERFLKLVQNADILYYSGHFGTPKVLPNTQVLQLKPADADKLPSGFVEAGDVRTALQNKRGPRLVIVNGCHSSDMGNSAVPADNLMPSAFGISRSTQGKAYLGWQKLAVGFVGDDQMGKFLDAWTTPDSEGNYPTLLEAKGKAGIANLDIIGDQSLRYNVPFLLSSTDPKSRNNKPLRMNWQLTDANKAVATLDFGADYEKEFKKMGFDRKMKLNFVREKDAFVLRDEQFGKFMVKLAEEMAAGLGGLFEDKPNAIKATATVREVSIIARADGENLRFNIKVNISGTVTRPKMPPKTQEFIKGTFEMIAKPVQPTPRVPS
jgi:hypothetical protein